MRFARSLASTWRHAAHGLRMMVGLPEYSRYLAHHKKWHPHCKPLSEAEFFRACQQARYGGSGGRCC